MFTTEEGNGLVSSETIRQSLIFLKARAAEKKEEKFAFLSALIRLMEIKLHLGFNLNNFSKKLTADILANTSNHQKSLKSATTIIHIATLSVNFLNSRDKKTKPWYKQTMVRVGGVFVGVSLVIAALLYHYEYYSSPLLDKYVDTFYAFVAALKDRASSGAASAA